MEAPRGSPETDLAPTFKKHFNEKLEDMDAAALTRQIAERYEGVTSVENAGDTFFTYDPDDDLPEQGWFPFVTVVTDDNYDTVSRLSEPGAYRVNLGLAKSAYTARLGSPPKERGADGVLATDYDYAARDTLLPHPYYASQYWVCVVNPDDTLTDVWELLDEAYAFTVRKHHTRNARSADR